MLEEILQWRAYQVRSLFEEQGFIPAGMRKVETDTLSFVGASAGKTA
jgi:hypothetical protein